MRSLRWLCFCCVRLERPAGEERSGHESQTDHPRNHRQKPHEQCAPKGLDPRVGWSLRVVQDGHGLTLCVPRRRASFGQLNRLTTFVRQVELDHWKIEDLAVLVFAREKRDPARGGELLPR